MKFILEITFDLLVIQIHIGNHCCIFRLAFRCCTCQTLVEIAIFSICNAKSFKMQKKVANLLQNFAKKTVFLICTKGLVECFIPAFCHKKCWKWLFQSAFGMCSTQTLVKIYNKPFMQSQTRKNRYFGIYKISGENCEIKEVFQPVSQLKYQFNLDNQAIKTFLVAWRNKLMLDWIASLILLGCFCGKDYNIKCCLKSMPMYLHYLKGYYKPSGNLARLRCVLSKLTVKQLNLQCTLLVIVS